jgi:hypothetical protein
VRWKPLIKLALVAMGAWIADRTVGNLCWTGMISSPLPVAATSAIGAAIFVLAAGLVEIAARRRARLGALGAVVRPVADDDRQFRPRPAG